MNTFANAHALVIGIAEYQHLTPLPKVKDAPDVAALLTDPAFCGYARDNVRVLLDAAATQEAIRAELAALAARTDKNSTVFLYFSGHGGQVPSGPRAGEYLLPVDAVYPSEEDLARTALSGAEFTAALTRIPAAKALVVLDCCHAGGIGQPRDLGPAPPVRPLPQGYYDALAAGTGRAILASSLAGQFSYVRPGAEYGVFTRHLLAGLRGGARSEDGKVRVFELFNYVRREVAAEQPNQIPYFRFSGQDNLAVALSRGGAPEEPRGPDGEFFYDAYISFADREPDAGYVYDTLVPRLESEGLRVVVSTDPPAEMMGVDRVASAEEGIKKSKRTVVVLTDGFLRDHWANFQASVAMTIGMDKGQYRLLPVKVGLPLDDRAVPISIARLVIPDLARPRNPAQQWKRLVDSLKGQVPLMGR